MNPMQTLMQAMMQFGGPQEASRGIDPSMIASTAPQNYVAPTNPALIESAVSSPGYGASSSGPGANAYPQQAPQLPQAMPSFQMPAQAPVNMSAVGDPHEQQKKAEILAAMLAQKNQFSGGNYA